MRISYIPLIVAVSISTLDELKFHLSKYKSGYLFRGQTVNHIHEDGKISITSSFARNGCIPHLMFKWVHYSKALLRAFCFEDYHYVSVELSQAVLQHYGWRSFFIDVSKSAHIACWFAANKYEEQKNPEHRDNHLEFSFNDWVWLEYRTASYSSNNDVGHIYIIDSSVLEELKINVTDLTQIKSKSPRLRFHAQDACLISTIKGRLPPEAIVAHLTVEHNVLLNFYQENGINNTPDLFPNCQEDYILKGLLNIHWIEKFPKGNLLIYERALEIPEYYSESKFVSNAAFYKEFWIADEKDVVDSPLNQFPFFKIPENAYFANKNEPFTLENVNELFKEHNGFVVELDGLIKLPELDDNLEYEKGIYVEKLSDSTVGVSGLVVHFRGCKFLGYAVTRGWVYQINGNSWEKINHPDECPCNNSLRHELQFLLLRVLNHCLRDNLMVKENGKNYVYKDMYGLGTKPIIGSNHA